MPTEKFLVIIEIYQITNAKGILKKFSADKLNEIK